MVASRCLSLALTGIVACCSFAISSNIETYFLLTGTHEMIEKANIEWKDATISKDRENSNKQKATQVRKKITESLSETGKQKEMGEMYEQKKEK